jgi:glutaredoxin/glutathione-dependent peroxiredoxin
MTIAVGDPIPDVTVSIMKDGSPADISARELLGSGRVVLFAVPGAFTPGCSKVHLPGYAQNAQEIAGQGVDQIACISVNDTFVMEAWGEAHGVIGSITMVGDGDANFAQATGLVVDLPSAGLGHRSQRYAMVINEGVVEELLLEENGLSVANSTAECVLDRL